MVFQLDHLSLYYDLRTVRDTFPILFLHSALATSGELEALRTRFADRTTLSLDLPGHGNSIISQDIRDALHTSGIADIVAQLLDALKISTVDVIGYSLGGYIALELAARSPKTVRSVVSHAMKYEWEPSTIESAIETFAKAPAPTETIAHVATLLRHFNQRQLTIPEIQRSRVPILLSTGDFDTFVTPIEVERLVANIGPMAQSNIFADVRHSWRSMPVDRFEEYVRNFWHELS